MLRLSLRPASTRSDAHIGVVLAVIAGAVALGGLTAWSPLAGFGFISALALLGLFVVRHAIPNMFLLALAGGLAGYAFFGRGFAYLGLNPLFVSEMLLGLGVLAVAMVLYRLRLRFAHVVILAFIAWGLAQTIPYLAVYGVEALRDAVVWGYALFALAVSALIRREHLSLVTHWYGRLLLVFVLWAPLGFVATLAISGLPNVPGSDVPILALKGGDVGVHLGGAASFVLLGLWSRRSTPGLATEMFFWVAWLGSVVIAGAINRGGFLAAFFAIGVAFILRPTRHAVTLGFVAVLLLASVVLINPTIDVGQERDISVEQLAENVWSIVGRSSGQVTGDGTSQWRLQWWGDIVDYTIAGPHFWTGKGFGVNLAIDDGYQGTMFADNRSPHNGHMTVLARMGVPGIALWALLQLTFAVTMMRTVIRAQQRGDTLWWQMSVWTLVYWLAMIVNMSFDVYLEGPQGGIWFWAVMGFGFAVAWLYQEAEDDNEERIKPGTG